jgi:hypothetical protein
MAIGRSIFVIIIMSLSSLGCLGGSVESSNNDGNSGGITYDKNLAPTNKVLLNEYPDGKYMVSEYDTNENGVADYVEKNYNGRPFYF